jgi:hypothetical protein
MDTTTGGAVVEAEFEQKVADAPVLTIVESAVELSRLAASDGGRVLVQATAAGQTYVFWSTVVR